MTTTVSDVMTRWVVALREDAEYKLHKQTDPEMPAGLHRLSWRLDEHTKATAITAGEVMTAPAIVVDPAAPLRVAAKVMQDNQVKRLPVATAGGRLVGVVSRTDLLSVFERPDADIWTDVIKLMVSEDLALNPDNFDITVRSGIVTLCGPIDRRETALNLLAQIRHAEGVVGVRDRLSYPAGS